MKAPDLDDLAAFAAIARRRSFRAAAVERGVSVSTLSQTLRDLEARLDLRLINRTTRSVALTRDGAMLAEVARRVTGELAEVTLALRAEAQLQKGLVTVVAMPTFAYMLLPQLMCRYADQHPQVEVRLLDFDSPKALEMLQRGEADLAVLAKTPDMDGFEFVHLFEDELVVLAPAASQLLEGRTEVMVEEVAREQLVLSPSGSQTRALVEQIFARAQCSPQVRQECQRPQTLLALVENGLGITILPRTALVDMNLSQVRLARLQSRPMREVGIVTLRSLSLSPAAQSFKDFLAQARPQAEDDKPLSLGFGELRHSR